MHIHRRRQLVLVPRQGRALSGVSTEIPARLPRYSLGSLGDDNTTSGTTLTGGTTLSTPTILDPQTQQFQAMVMDQLQQGVKLMQTANLTKWLQIAATLAIPLTAAVWKAIFKKGVSIPGV